MSLKNTADHYGTVARWLHWSIAILFLGAYCAVYYRHWFTEPKTTANTIALQLHLSCGLSAAALVVVRIVWRFMNQQPRLEPGGRVAHLAAHWGHFALYFIMIAAPLTGYLGTGANTKFFFLLDVPNVQSTTAFQTFVVERGGLTFDEFEEPIDVVHKAILGKWIVWLLVVGHALAALYHHFVKRDRTLVKMTGGRTRNALS